MQSFDVVIIGAGAAGLFCAGVAGQLGLKVLVLDHADKVAEKIRISGGGRCNFTNRDTSAANFLSENPRFCRSALSRYTPRDFTALLDRHRIAYHEKHKGQLFCDRSAEDIIQMLLAECDAGHVTRWQPCAVRSIRFSPTSPRIHWNCSYEIDSDRGPVVCAAVVVATGGLSIPKIGATDFGYRVAQQFGLPLVTPRPALVPLTFDEAAWAPFAQLAGLSLPVRIETGGKSAPTLVAARTALPPEGVRLALGRPGGKSAPTLVAARTALPPEGVRLALGRPGGKTDKIAFLEDLLFTHRGLSGPGVLQISSYWQPGTPIRLNLAPDTDVAEYLAQAKARSRKRIANEIAALVPARLADTWVAQGARLGHQWERPINEASDKALAALAEHLSRWELTPTGTEGYRKAEVTAGGVDTRALSSQTLEASQQPGLFFIGEVVDVTGWLGGYNFQWAWASAFACAQGLAEKLKT